MNRALLATEPPLLSDEVRRDLEDAGITIVAETSDPAALAQLVVRHAAEFVVATTDSATPGLFAAAAMLATLEPCPFIVFTSNADVARIERAAASNVHAYVVDGYARHRLSSVIQVARARFRHEQVLREEIVGLSRRFEERKLVDRAKGLLMRSRGIQEDEAFELLRSLAMQSRQRIGVVAQSVCDRSRAGEAVNRAGQLRMLSQRLVLWYAQALNGHDPAAAARIIGDCVQRVDANLGILRKAISTPGYGERVDRVEGAWTELRGFCESTPRPEQLDVVDRSAECMLRDAEALTGFLESSGLVASLHVINVAGRQRMLCQRIAKLCFLLVLRPSAPGLTELHERAADFQIALDALKRLPLSTPAIVDVLGLVTSQWEQLRLALAAHAEASALVRVADLGERLLEASERLTDLYEQAMQVLIGDRMGRLR